MMCTYGISSKLPSLFHKKYFSCHYMCFSKNVVDVCDNEESLIIETVHEKIQLTPLLEQPTYLSSLGSVSSLNQRSIRDVRVLERSRVVENGLAIAFQDGRCKSAQKKSKRRKKKKQRTRCGHVKGEHDDEDPFRFFQSDGLSSNTFPSNNIRSGKIIDIDCDFNGNASQDVFHYEYDRTSFSHITSEKESAYSEDNISRAVRVRRRKKLRRKRRKSKAENLRKAENLIKSEDVVDNKYSQNKQIDNNTDLGKCKKIIDRTRTYNVQLPASASKDISFEAGQSSRAYKTDRTQIYSANKPVAQDVKLTEKTIVGSRKKILGDPEICGDTGILVDTKVIGGPLDGPSKIGCGDPGNIREHFSRQRKRQVRKKMRDVKERPESYIILGLI